MFESKRLSARDKPHRVLTMRLLRRLTRKNIKTYPQLVVFSFDRIGSSININGRFEREVLTATFEFLDHMGLNKRDMMLDIGANIGNHAVFFADHFKTVHAFEPNPRTCAVLAINAADRGIVVHNFGLSAADETLSFVEIAHNVGASRIGARPEAGEVRREIDINVKRLDGLDLVAGTTVDVMKIDVEGHELAVLEGARDTIARDRPVILFEQEKTEFRGGTSPTIQFLADAGYRFYTARRNFELPGGAFGKFAGLLMRTIWGESRIFQECQQFETRFYDMIVAVPRGDPA